MVALALFLMALFSAEAKAAELLGPDVGVVPFGMGRAYSAVADDWLALHYNPAGLALVTKGEVQAFDLKLGTNANTLTAKSDLDDISNDDDSVAAVLNGLAGKHVRGEISNVTQFTLPHFALAFQYDVKADVDVQNTAYPKVLARYTKDFSIPVGFAGAVGKRKNLRFGARVAYVNRQGGLIDVPISQITADTGSLLDQLQQKGSGWSTTLGTQYTVPTKGRTEVNFAAVWHDVGKTSFGPYSSNNRPTRIEDTITVGTAIRFPIGGRQNRRLERRYGSRRSTNHLTFAFDYSHLEKSLDREHFPKHIHLGMNLDLPILSLQLGLNQTSLTFGSSFDIGILRVAVASYAEELGSYGGQKRDRRYLLSIGSSFGISKLGRR